MIALDVVGPLEQETAHVGTRGVEATWRDRATQMTSIICRSHLRRDITRVVVGCEETIIGHIRVVASNMELTVEALQLTRRLAIHLVRSIRI